ncbi:MAG: Fic family protein [Pedobacter sp.]|uniref:Fic family protein n=1 Tax=Pedobacter sp. TaxID=1411316 RepID=UPI00356AE1E4
MNTYIYQNKDWPNFTWNYEHIAGTLGAVRNLQGKLTGKMEALGFSLREEALLETLTLDVLKSTEIEGVILQSDQVRSSIARHLGMDAAGLVPSDRYVDGVVQMMLDATQHPEQPLISSRLFNWQAALFPTGRSGIYKITVGDWRKDESGPMQVVSGAYGKERVHYQAPAAVDLDKEMKAFLDWFNTAETLDPVIKAGIAHVWFVTVHPFDDGNGRIARAIADMQLARADSSKQRFYSMSAQIRHEQKAYYNILEKTQKGGLDVTEWLHWFLDCLNNALSATDKTLSKVLFKAKFWESNRSVIMNERQRLMINKLLEGFEGKLTSSKWAIINKCSADTALRDMTDLISKGILRKEAAGGRSTGYKLNG